MAANMRTTASVAPRTWSRPSRIASLTSRWPSSRSSTVTRSVAPSPCAARPVDCRTTSVSPAKVTSIDSSSRMIRACRVPTTRRMRASASGSPWPRASMSPATYCARLVGARSIDMLEHREPFAPDVGVPDPSSRHERAGDLVQEAVAAHDRVARDELRGRRRDELDLDPVDAVVGAHGHARGEPRRRTILVQRRQRPRQAAQPVRELPLVPDADGAATEAAPAIAALDDEDGVAGPPVRAVGRTRQHERRARSRCKERAPFPADVVTPEPSPPVVVVVRALAPEIDPTCSDGDLALHAEAWHHVPGDPPRPERQPLLEIDCRRHRARREAEGDAVAREPRRR